MKPITFTQKEIWWLQAILDYHRNELPDGISYGELYAKLKEAAV